MLSRHRFCCYIVFAQRVTLTLVRVTHFTPYPIYNFSIYWLFLSVICVGLHSVVDILVDFEPMYPGFESRESRFFIFFYFIFLFYVFFVIIITVQICKFNITVSTQFLLLYYSLWCPGLQRLQRFDFRCYGLNYIPAPWICVPSCSVQILL